MVMSERRYYLRLNESVLAVCKSMIGMQLDSLVAEQMQKDLLSEEMVLIPEVHLVVSEHPNGIQLGLEAMDEPGLPITETLSVKEAEIEARNVIVNLPAWFIVQKVEIWAEKVQADAGKDNVQQFTENTLMISSASGLRLLLTPDHPGSGFRVIFGEAEIESLLDSGHYVLKHVLD
jgi:hypothetical protein